MWENWNFLDEHYLGTVSNLKFRIDMKKCILEDGKKQVIDLYGRTRTDIHEHLSKTFCREL